MEEPVSIRSRIAEGRWWSGDWIRLSVALLASAYFLFTAATPGEWHFIDFVNLLIHEAGHVVFMPFGEFMHILGGSLFQVIFPMLYIGYFYIRRDYFSASLLVFWVGENLINVSVYASDAVVMQLPLLGGDTSGHDWHNILAMLHLLPATGAIGFSIYIGGVMTILVGALLSIAASQAVPAANTYAI
jgi:hypothetical protein